ncbi:MAG: hypothetical protein KGN36_17465 [Acidobacteriota bacterium]|nr:hypothetical protein [Acidobacteriota bacterium]
MPVLDSPYAAARLAVVVLGGVLAILLGILGWRAWQRSRVTPEERERRRRAWLAAAGKLGDAAIVEVRDDLLVYSYAVRGVEYTATQDLTRLAERVPADLSSLPHVSVKYDPRNPANSIVVAEEWSGLRVSRAGLR